MSVRAKKGKKSKIEKKLSLEYVTLARKQMLKDIGYDDLKRKHKKSLRPAMVNLSIDGGNIAPTSDKIGNGFKKRTGAEHKDAKQFPISLSHKQGYSLMLSNEDLSYAGGKKT